MLSVYSGSRDFFIIFSFTAKEGCFCFEYCNFISGYNYSFCLKKKKLLNFLLFKIISYFCNRSQNQTMKF